MGDLFAGVKKVLLMQENIERMERNIETLAHDLRRTRDYAATIDQRVARLEGYVDGATAAARFQPRLSGQ